MSNISKEIEKNKKYLKTYNLFPFPNRHLNSICPTTQIKENERPNHSITVLKSFLQSTAICDGVQVDVKTPSLQRTN